MTRATKSASSLPRIALNRRQAATALGVSPDLLKAAQEAGALRAKNTKFDAKGRAVGITLYDPADLKAWFDGLGDA
ncbi:hypothetical protein [Nocardioides montaniterrae]